MSDLKKKSSKKIVKNSLNSNKKTKTADEAKRQLNLDVEQTIANSAPNLKDSCRCSDCENMARNFLHLHRLLSSGSCSVKKHCDVCSSALSYLEYINEHLMRIFGETIRSAAENTGQSVSVDNAGCRILISLE
uniref:Uncharacterized protein n=1 Tax=Glossina brevipalpis TaxID=37001 RepID=A0A1A9X3Z3_9MUSC